MKMTLIGSGVRTVFFAETVAKHARRLGVEELAIMDNNPAKLQVYGELAKYAAHQINPDFTITLTSSGEEAIRDARAVVTTLRVGEDAGRVLDERIALRHGVIGQETTGAGGFAFALRSIPSMLEYCELAEKVGDHATVFNFTNPSGLVTQAMHTAGFHNVIGICDGPTHMKTELADALNVNVGDLYLNLYGLNHLSFTNSVKLRGKEILDKILASDAFLREVEEFRAFSPELIRALGNLPNEYLYYYYYRDTAFCNVSTAPETRGETIERINDRMLRQLSASVALGDRESSLNAYRDFMHQRESSYMSIETKMNKEAGEHTDFLKRFGLDALPLTRGSEYVLEGYAGVVFNYIEAVRNNAGIDLPLSVPNRGSIPFLEDTDIVEITCMIDENGASPIQIPAESVPERNRLLIQQVKLYEKLTVEAVQKHSKALAREALLMHPLVGSYETASALVEDYLNAFAAYVGNWR